MAHVYRARDTRLHRDAALKFLPPHLETDPDRLSRFRREAQALGALNHPGIAQVYGLEESAGTYAIAMELVNGETLSQRLERGPIAVGEALRIAKDIAEALEAAHEKGVVHRDLKPANIKVTPRGQVKVLDFGLAKAIRSPEVERSTDGPPALAKDPTADGLILGTAPYTRRNRRRARPRISEPMCSRLVACSTKCSQARERSTARPCRRRLRQF